MAEGRASYRERRLLIVDEERPVAAQLGDSVEERGFRVSVADTAPAALLLLSEMPHHVLITHADMPGTNGRTLLKEAKRLDPVLPVIAVVASDDVEKGVRAMREGAEDFVFRPFVPDQVEICVERALEKRELVIENRQTQEFLENTVEEKTHKLRYALTKVQSTFNATVEAMVSAIEARDCETQNHCRRAREYTMLLGRQLGLDPRALRDLAWGALLHDVGKIGVPDHILMKEGPLTSMEWDLMRKHPMIGYRLCAPIGFLKGAASIVLHHHEKWDGTGYPYGKQGEEIPFGARVFMVADAFETITSKRSYKEALSFEFAEQELLESAGTHFDPLVVEAFRRVGRDEWLRIRNKYLAEIEQGRVLVEERSAVLL